MSGRDDEHHSYRVVHLGDPNIVAVTIEDARDLFWLDSRGRRSVKHALVRADARWGEPRLGALLLPTAPQERTETRTGPVRRLDRLEDFA